MLGVAVSLDANVVLAQRDKFLSHLKGYISHRRLEMRNASLDTVELLPNLRSVLNVAHTDALREHTRLLAVRPGAGGRQSNRDYSTSSHHGGRGLDRSSF